MTYDPSDCPMCGEWRDGPKADCAACGFNPCQRCGHDHTTPPWTERDPADGTCWSTAGPLVCGCPKEYAPNRQGAA